MAGLEDLCSEFGLDTDAARQAVTAGGFGTERDSPWYIQAILGFGAWVSGLVITAFGVILVAVVLGIDEPGMSIVAIGVLFFAIGYAVLFGSGDSIFKTQFAVSVSAAGIALAVGGIGFQFEDIATAAFAAAAFATVVAATSPSLSLQGIVSALAAALGVASLIDLDIPYFHFAVSLTLVAGALLLMWPPRVELRPTAIILLFTAPLTMILLDSEFGFNGTRADGGNVWLAHAVHVGLFLWLSFSVWRRLSSDAGRIELAAFAVAATALSLILPPGGSAALAIMALAFVLGSRLLALGGVLFQIYFLVKFYYHMDTSLLIKSMILSAAGLVLIALWAVVQGINKRRAEG